MSVQITDCTIRDGGYLFNKNSDSNFVKGIMKGLADAGIDFAETGFLQTNVTGETLVYRDSVDVRKYLPDDRKNTQFLGFCDNSRYSLENLDDYDGTYPDYKHRTVSDLCVFQSRSDDAKSVGQFLAALYTGIYGTWHQRGTVYLSFEGTVRGNAKGP